MTFAAQRPIILRDYLGRVLAARFAHHHPVRASRHGDASSTRFRETSRTRYISLRRDRVPRRSGAAMRGPESRPNRRRMRAGRLGDERFFVMSITKGQDRARACRYPPRIGCDPAGSCSLNLARQALRRAASLPNSLPRETWRKLGRETSVARPKSRRLRARGAMHSERRVPSPHSSAHRIH